MIGSWTLAAGSLQPLKPVASAAQRCRQATKHQHLKVLQGASTALGHSSNSFRPQAAQHCYLDLYAFMGVLVAQLCLCCPSLPGSLILLGYALQLQVGRSVLPLQAGTACFVLASGRLKDLHKLQSLDAECRRTCMA